MGGLLVRRRLLEVLRPPAGTPVRGTRLPGALVVLLTAVVAAAPAAGLARHSPVVLVETDGGPCHLGVLIRFSTDSIALFFVVRRSSDPVNMALLLLLRWVVSCTWSLCADRPSTFHVPPR